MSKLSRSWTLYLKTDKEAFRNAFFKVVNSRDYKVPRSGKVDLGFRVYVYKKYAIGEDCSGSIYTESFNINKLVDKDYGKRLEGKMKEDDNGLRLELHVRAGYYEFTRFLWAFFLGLFFCYSFYRLLFDHLPGDNNYLWLICFVLPGFAISCWAGYKVQQRFMDKLKHDFTTVLKEIEKHAVSDKDH